MVNQVYYPCRYRWQGKCTKLDSNWYGDKVTKQMYDKCRLYKV